MICKFINIFMNQPQLITAYSHIWIWALQEAFCLHWLWYAISSSCSLNGCMTLVVLSSFLIQVVSITMIPLLRKFRERANTGHPYVPLGIGDQHSVTTFHSTSQVMLYPKAYILHRWLATDPIQLSCQMHTHPCTHAYGPMNITEQNPPYPGQYSTQPPAQHGDQSCYSGKEAQPRAELLDFAAAPIAQLPQ